MLVRISTAKAATFASLCGVGLISATLGAIAVDGAADSAHDRSAQPAHALPRCHAASGPAMYTLRDDIDARTIAMGRCTRADLHGGFALTLLVALDGRVARTAVDSVPAAVEACVADAMTYAKFPATDTGIVIRSQLVFP